MISLKMEKIVKQIIDNNQLEEFLIVKNYYHLIGRI